jgi:hypothetical protein
MKKYRNSKIIFRNKVQLLNPKNSVFNQFSYNKIIIRMVCFLFIDL